jgi:RND family efflux transporter MFP subunit
MKLDRLLLTFALLVPLAVPAQDPPASPVNVALARKELVAPALSVPGTVISRDDSRIAAEVEANLVWIAEVGTRLKKGDTLARLNDRELNLRLRSNEAEIARLKAQSEYLKRQVQRLTQLASTNTAALAELDQTTSESGMLEQQIKAAEVARDETLYNIERTRVAAPFPGVVVERARTVGEFVNRGAEIARLVNTEALEIRVQAPLHVVRHVKEGDIVTVVSDSKTVRTQVRSVVPVGDEVSRQLQLHLVLENSDWIIGEPVRVSVSQGAPAEALTVPRDALVLREGETYVYTINADNTARKVKVTRGEGAGDWVPVTGNLKPGDQIVIRGAERLQDGSAVTIIKDAGAASSRRTVRERAKT